jgi:hypothetical protein
MSQITVRFTEPHETLHDPMRPVLVAIERSERTTEYANYTLGEALLLADGINALCGIPAGHKTDAYRDALRRIANVDYKQTPRAAHAMKECAKEALDE